MAIVNGVPRSAKTLILLAFLLIVLTFSWRNIETEDLSKYALLYSKATGQKVPEYSIFASNSTGTHPLPKTPEADDFWRDFSQMLVDGNPEGIIDTLFSNETAAWVGWEGTRRDSEMPDYLTMSDEQIEQMTALHARVVEDVKKMAGKLPYIPGTRGIVTTAGPTADAMTMTSLRMLRASGSRLPVQLWMFSEKDYDQFACEHIYKPMDVTCMIMTDYLPKETLENGTMPLEISHHFQMKILTILFSTFEQTLFVDCDLFPVNNPDSIFVTEPFLSAGYVLWPDYWAIVNSPKYFKIANKTPIRQYTRQSTESGAMLMDKSTHASAMVLAAYYNRYGPKHYYWLFTQGGCGHGDKDTFLPAVQFFDLPFYQVDSSPRRVGYRCEDNERPIGSAQHHPYDDWLITSKGYSRAHGGLLNDLPIPRTLFIHGNLPKNDPVSLMDWYIPESWQDQIRCNQGEGDYHRQWGSKEFNVLYYGYDAEKRLWDQMRWLACTHEHNLKRWTEGLKVACTEESAKQGWCPKTDIGGTWLFQKPTHDVCSRFLAVYEGVLPGEVYDPSLPRGGLPERPWSSMADAVAL